MKKLLLILTVMSTLQIANAQKFTYEYKGVTLEYIIDRENGNDNETAQVMDMVSSSQDTDIVVTIPSFAIYKNKSYPVTEIANGCFSWYSNITGISIPPTINDISGDKLTMSNPYDLIIEDGVTELYVGNDFNLTKIKSLYLGRNVRAMVPNEGEYENLTELTVGNLVSRLVSECFKDSPNLEKVRIGNSLKLLPDEAFKDCPELKEVRLSASVSTIGNEAFYGCGKLKTIEMGKVSGIGEDAFYGCPLESITVTALRAPFLTQNKSFSNFTAVLNLQENVDLITYEEQPGWEFENIKYLPLPTVIKADTEKVITGKAGETIHLEATLEPSDIVLPYIFWSSSDPTVAIVDLEGNVTLQKDITEDGDGCRITAVSLYTGGPTAEFTIGNPLSGIEQIANDTVPSVIDYTVPYTVYGLDGRKVEERIGASMEGLAKGIYILRQGEVATKILVKK